MSEEPEDSDPDPEEEAAADDGDAAPGDQGNGNEDETTEADGESPEGEQPAEGQESDQEGGEAEPAAGEEATEAEPEDEAEGDQEAAEEDDTDAGEDELSATPEELAERLEGIAESLAAAETEADLDDVEEELDGVAEAVEALPDADEDAEEDPKGDLQSDVEELRGDLEEARGPYASDVVESVEASAGTVTDTRWTENGLPDVAAAVETFLDSAGETLDSEFAAESEEPEALAAALEEAAGAVGDAGLDADADEEAIAELLEAAEELSEGLEAAEEWDDLTVRQKLDAGGFYDVLTPKNRKDFPPELTVVRIAEAEHDPETILTGLDYFDSDFMEENCVDALRRMGPVEAFEEMEARAQKRNKPAIEVLGKIGDERALETLHEYIDGDADPALQTVTLRAVGEIGSEESTQQVADRLVADEAKVRSAAARALGRIGDTRAIDPLAVVLDGDEEGTVRASAAWALYAIGTREALETAAEYVGDDAYLVAAEAERAAEALEAGEAEAAA